MAHTRTTLSLWLIALSWLAGVLLTVDARREPMPRGASTPPTEFSQARAQRVLQLVAGDGQPRMVGSEANARAVDRLFAELEHEGLAPERQRTFVCASVCGNVENLVARIEGTERDSVLLVAHHDSVGAGPGASDDGFGIAVLLETVRALRAGPPLRHGVIILISDGEEVGLLGAHAFAAEHRWMKDVGAVINVDSGGSAGLSLLYETGAGNLGVIERYAREAKRPATSSLFSVVHKYLPRGSDFSVFAQRGLAGINSGLAGDAVRYHTSLDTVALAHPGSLQHQGDSVLTAARALVRSPEALAKLVTREGVWFDLFGTVVVRWPAAWSLPMCALACALLALAWRICRSTLAAESGEQLGSLRASGTGAQPRKAAGASRDLPSDAVGVSETVPSELHAGERVRIAAIARAGSSLQLGAAALAFVAALVTPCLAGALAFAAQLLLERAGLVPATFVSDPTRIFVAMLALGLLAVCAAAHVLARFDRRCVALGVWCAWALGACVTSAAFPGASLLFLPATLAAAAMALAVSLAPRSRSLATCIVASVVAATWFPSLALAPDSFGISGLPLFAAPAAWIGTVLLPDLAACTRRRRHLLLTAAGVIALAAVAAHASLRMFDDHAPQRVNVLFYADRASQHSYAIVDTAWIGPQAMPPEPLRAALAELTGKPPRYLAPFAWRMAPALVAQLKAADEASLSQLKAADAPSRSQLKAADAPSSSQLSAPGAAPSAPLTAAESGSSSLLRSAGASPSAPLTAADAARSSLLSAPDAAPSAPLTAAEPGSSSLLRSAGAGPSSLLRSAGAGPSAPLTAADAARSSLLSAPGAAPSAPLTAPGPSLLSPLAHAPAPQPMAALAVGTRIDVVPSDPPTTLHVQLAASVRRLTVLTIDSDAIRALHLGAHRLPSSVQPGEHGVRYRSWNVFAPTHDLRLRVEWAAAQHSKAELLFVTEAAGLPELLAPLLRARPSWAAASQHGDRSIEVTSLQL